MKRALIGVVLASVVLSVVLATSAAVAAPSPRATITLTSDKNASATVMLVSMTSSEGVFAGSADHLSCGPDSSENGRAHV